MLFLSTGGTCWHADARRMSIAAAIRWALESNLQGLVLDSGAVQEQSQAVALARSKGLKVSPPSSTAKAMSWHRIAPLPGLQCSSCRAAHDAFRCCLECSASFDTQPCHSAVAGDLDGWKWVSTEGNGLAAMQVLTYGLQNNDPAWVRHQYTLGVQGAIVDDVEGVVSAFGRAAVQASQARRSAELAAQEDWRAECYVFLAP